MLRGRDTSVVVHQWVKLSEVAQPRGELVIHLRERILPAWMACAVHCMNSMVYVARPWRYKTDANRVLTTSMDSAHLNALQAANSDIEKAIMKVE